MTILQHHNKREFGDETYFRVRIPRGFETFDGIYPFPLAYLFHLADGNFVIRPFLNKNKHKAYITKDSISSLEVIKRYN